MPNVELFMRGTKLGELSLWNVRRLAQLSSSEWVWIVRHVLSVYKIDSGANVDLRMRRNKLTDFKHLYGNAYLASSGRQFIKIELKLLFNWSDSVDWFDAF